VIDGWCDAFEPDLSPEYVLVFRIEGEVFPRRGATFKNDARIRQLTQFAGFLDDHALNASSNAVHTAAESEHVSIKPEPSISAPVIQSDLDQVFWFDPHKLAGSEIQYRMG
jgi:hypothetical protein